MTGLTEAPTDDGSWKSRAWPGVRAIVSSWTGFRGNTRIIIRHVSMWTVLILRVLISVLIAIKGTLGYGIGHIIVSVIVIVLNILFITWCLSMIDRAQGYRKVFGVRIGRNHLDIFLGICAILHVIIIAGFLAINGVGASIFWFALWALIAVYGFICTKRPYEVA